MARLVQADRKATVTEHYSDAIQKRISGCTLNQTLNMMSYSSKWPLQVVLTSVKNRKI